MSEIQKLQERAVTWPERARAVVVADQQSYDLAGELRRGIKALLDEADATFTPIKKAQDAAKAATLTEERRTKAPLAEADTILQRKRLDWEAAQERLRREIEEQVREAERLRAASEAERQIEAMEAAGAAPAEVSAAIEEAEFQVQSRVALAVEQARAAAPLARSAGISTRRTWRGRFTNLRALVAYIAAGHWEYLHLIEGSEPKLNALARAQGEQLRIPGVEVFEVRSEAVRR